MNSLRASRCAPLISAAACVASAVPVASFAQNAGDSTSPVLEEVVVTSQRRAENLQRVPVSVQVVTAETLSQQNLNGLMSMTQTVPSVHIGVAGRVSEIYMRGIGSGTNQAFDQSVGMFIDDIYHGRSRTSAASFLDLERVEVLKGPQSLFFGNNAIAGAFNIVTRKPSKEFELSARALYGEDGQYAGEFATGGALTDKLAVRVAAIATGQDGWINNVNLGEHIPHENNVGGRVTLAFTPSDAFDAIFKVEGGHNRMKGFVSQQINCPPNPPFVASGFCALAIAQGQPLGLEADRAVLSDGSGTEYKTFESVLTLNAYVNGHTLTSTTGYHWYDWVLNYDGDLLPPTLLNTQAPERYNQFSQEFRVASPTGGRFEYMAGAYYQSGHLNFQQHLNATFLTPTISSIPAFAALVPYLPLGQTVDYSQPEESHSVFGSVTLNATDRLKLTGGLRYTWVDKDYTWNLRYGTATQAFGGIVPTIPATLIPLVQALRLGTAGTSQGSRHDAAWLPSVRVQYDLTPDVMTYASYAKGFKAGGFNGADTTAVAANFPFSPEWVNAYEVGIKSEPLRNLMLNLAVYRSEYSDLQVSTSVNLSGANSVFVRNAASVRSQGVEFESRWAATSNFDIALNLDYIHSRYVDYPNAPPSSLQTLRGQTVQDLSGQPTLYAPDWSGSLTATYTARLTDRYELTAEVSPRYSSGFSLFATNDPNMRQGAYTRFDARLSLNSVDGKWGVDLIGKNLSDEVIANYAGPMPTSLGSYVKTRQQPRNLAVQLRYKW